MSRVNRYETERRITFIVKLMARGLSWSEIEKAVQQEFGCTPRAASTWVRKARLRCRVEGEEERDQIRSESLAFYRELIQRAMKDGNLTVALNARKRIDDLFGSDAPKKMGVDVNDTRERRELIEYLKALTGVEQNRLKAIVGEDEDDDNAAVH